MLRNKVVFAAAILALLVAVLYAATPERSTKHRRGSTSSTTTGAQAPVATGSKSTKEQPKRVPGEYFHLPDIRVAKPKTTLKERQELATKAANNYINGVWAFEKRRKYGEHNGKRYYFDTRFEFFNFIGDHLVDNALKKKFEKFLDKAVARDAAKYRLENVWSQKERLYNTLLNDDDRKGLERTSPSRKYRDYIKKKENSVGYEINKYNFEEDDKLFKFIIENLNDEKDLKEKFEELLEDVKSAREFVYYLEDQLNDNKDITIDDCEDEKLHAAFEKYGGDRTQSFGLGKTYTLKYFFRFICNILPKDDEPFAEWFKKKFLDLDFQMEMAAQLFLEATLNAKGELHFRGEKVDLRSNFFTNDHYFNAMRQAGVNNEPRHQIIAFAQYIKNNLPYDDENNLANKLGKKFPTIE